MKIPIFSQSIVSDLYNNLEKNLDGYLKGFNESFFKNNYNNLIENTEISDEFSEKLNIDNSLSPGMLDVKNSITVYKELKGITPYQARDGRIWCALSHKFFREYALYRHIERVTAANKTDEWQLKILRQHFFTKGGLRGIDRYNVASRLWWNGYVVDRCREQHDFEELIHVLCANTDIRQMIVERPGIFQIPVVTLAVLLSLKKYNETKNILSREVYRKWIILINNGGGQNMYATMNLDKLLDLFEGYFQEVTDQ